MTHPVQSFTIQFSLTIEYSQQNGQRVQKTFDDPLEARRFYAAKSKKGYDPHIVNGEKRN